MRRPVIVATAAIAILLFLGAPFRHIELSLPDDRGLPEAASSRQVHDVLREEFSGGEAGAASVVALGVGEPGSRNDDIDSYASTLARLPGVARVDAATGTYCGEGLAELGCTPGAQVPPGGEGRYLDFDSTGAGGSTSLSVVPSVDPLSIDRQALVPPIPPTDGPSRARASGMSPQ